MKLTATVAILVSASFGAADVGDLIGYEHIECESSDASPYMHHIAQLVEILRDEDDSNLCFNEMLGMRSNRCGSTIKTYTGKDGGAVFSLCSGDMDEWDELMHRDYHVSSQPLKRGAIAELKLVPEHASRIYRM